jgi:hypothetical protein
MEQASHIPHPHNRVEPTGSRYTAFIAAHEWRWVIIVSCALVLLAFLPLVWVALRGTPGYQFMGTLHNYLDGATYLSKMRIGEDGGWMVTFQHTPETHNGAYIMVIYPLLGQLANATGVPLLVMFHAARVIASLLMYAAIYQLSASIWMRIEARRVFFIIAAIGGGFGWLFGPLLGMAEIPDLSVPEAFPMFSTFANVHFPLAIGCLALLIGMLITALRPAPLQDTAFDNGWWIASILSVLLSLIYPQTLVPLGGALALYALTHFLQTRRLDRRVLRWTLAVIVPAIPFVLYYNLIVVYNPAMQNWNAQNVTSAPPIWTWAIALGLPLVVALPALWRAARRMELDGDRLMMLWLVCIFIAMYAPTNIQRRFSVGLMLPIAYFATRAVHDFWYARIKRRARPLLAVFIPIIAVTPLLMLFLPVLPAMMGNPETAAVIFLDSDYVRAYQWIDTRTDSDDVVLASPDGSIWLPGWAGTRVVYGHQYETLDADIKLGQVTNWFSASDPAQCAALIAQYDVRYVLRGGRENALGQSVCFDALRLVIQFDDVAVYAP